MLVVTKNIAGGWGVFGFRQRFILHGKRLPGQKSFPREDKAF